MKFTETNNYKNMQKWNDIDNTDIDGNKVLDPLFLYTPIRRQGNDIYLYSEIDTYSQLVFMQLVNDIQSEIIAKNALKILNGECQEAITIHICSPGGLLSAGLAMYDFIKNLKVHTIGVVEGMAMSAASLILLACSERRMTDNSVVLVHQLSGGLIGKASEMKDEFVNVEKAMARLKAIYLKETKIGLTIEMIDELNSKETIEEIEQTLADFAEARLPVLESLLQHDLELDIDQCVKYGLVDSDHNLDQIELDDEDAEKIQEFMEKLVQNKVKAKAKEEKQKTKRKKK